MSKDFDAVTRHCWAMAQRVGTQIAELPVRVREVAFGTTPPPTQSFSRLTRKARFRRSTVLSPGCR